MQTRKKSISLHALGVISSTPRGSAAHRSNSSAHNASTSDSHPAKRLKRSHTLSTPAPTPDSLEPAGSALSTSFKHRQTSPPAIQATPPPSPDDHPVGKIDKSGINDDIVVAVLEQLEATGNRPHLIRELAAILANQLRSVQSSSNPVAIISSRLTNYLRRSWTAIAPCPLTKEQVNIQPRRVYYYLTTCARQPIPELARRASLSASRIISPSLSSGPEDEEQPRQDNDRKGREAMSPSPEVDLSAPEYDHSHETMGDISFLQSSEYPSASMFDDVYQQAAGPPLESDEREFTQTATVMATRKAVEQSATSETDPALPSLDPHSQHPTGTYLSVPDTGSPDHVMQEQDETEEMRHLRNHEAASALFGGQYSHLGINSAAQMALNSSPLICPMLSTKATLPPVTAATLGSALDDDTAWHELRSPDCVELSELDDLLGGV